MNDARVSETAAMELTGHRSRDAFNAYGRVNEDRRNDAIRAIETFVAPENAMVVSHSQQITTRSISTDSLESAITETFTQSTSKRIANFETSEQKLKRLKLDSLHNLCLVEQDTELRSLLIQGIIDL